MAAYGESSMSVFLAAFNDGEGAVRFLKQKLQQITGPISSMQLRELAAELAFLNVHLKTPTWNPTCPMHRACTH
jgi:hypothetical protein